MTALEKVLAEEWPDGTFGGPRQSFASQSQMSQRWLIACGAALSLVAQAASSAPGVHVREFPDTIR